jgi:uncharacterized membrane protein YfcA
MINAGYIALGLVAGILSGMIGIGGGILIVPVLVYIFGFTQHTAQGTTLALMIPPIGILAVLEYYKAGNVDIKVAALVCLGFVFGGFLGAKLAINIPDDTLKRIFGVILLLISLKMIFWK